MSKSRNSDKPAPPVSFVEITNCCCGVVHRMTRDSWNKFQSVTRGKHPNMPVGTGLDCWLVPRVYIACHGIKATELPALARQYEWERV